MTEAKADLAFTLEEATAKISDLIGAIPAALKLSEGSESRQPMSVALFGGLFTSTLLTLLVIPVMYIVLDNLKEFLGRKLFQKALP